jgi:pheromone a factor receptor
MHTELPVGAFIAAFAVLIPLPWHWRARNVPTLSLIAWLFASNIIIGINAIIWAGNVNIVVPVWCDIGKCYNFTSSFANRLSINIAK